MQLLTQASIYLGHVGAASSWAFSTIEWVLLPAIEANENCIRREDSDPEPLQLAGAIPASRVA